MQAENLFIAFIGGGNMAQAIFSGISGKLCKAKNIHVIEINEEKRIEWERNGATVSAQVDSRLAHCHVWIYAVKPKDLKNAINSTYSWIRKDTLVISIVAGISSNTLNAWFREKTSFGKLLRCMPNTPALIRNGVTVLLESNCIDSECMEVAEKIFKTVGTVFWVNNDEIFDAITALSGSGPAYVYLFLESIINGGIELGLNKELSYNLTVSTFLGSVNMIIQSKESPETLRQRVTSKGGTTEAALDVFNSCKFVEIVQAALAASAKRSQELKDHFSSKKYEHDFIE